MRKVLLAGAITMLIAGCVAPFPPGYGVSGGWPQEYYSDGGHYGGGPFYVERPFYGAPRRYYGRPRYYDGRPRYYSRDYPRNYHYYRGDDDRDDDDRDDD
ncbi:MAG: hypothetical protein WCA06_13070 [Terrimicrobiaceae bacterium]